MRYAASDAVAHQFKVAVGRDKGQHSLLLVARIPNARVEGAVVDNFGILERKEQIGNAAQMRLGLNGATHVGRNDIAHSIHNGINLLHDINVYFVVGIGHPRLSPGHIAHRPCRQCLGHHRAGPTGHGRRELAHDGRRSDHVLEAVGLRRQRPAEVAHLLQQLVDGAEIVLDGRLVGRTAKVIHEYVGHPVQKLQHEQRCDLVGTGGQVRQSVPQDAEQIQRRVGVGIDHLHHRRDRIVQRKGVGGDDGGRGGDPSVMVEVGRGPLPERLADAAGGDAAEMPLYDHLPRRRQQEYRLDHGGVAGEVWWAGTVHAR